MYDYGLGAALYTFVNVHITAVSGQF